MKFNVRLVFRIAFQVLVTLDLHVWDLAGSIFIKSAKKNVTKTKTYKIIPRKSYCHIESHQHFYIFYVGSVQGTSTK